MTKYRVQQKVTIWNEYIFECEDVQLEQIKADAINNGSVFADEELGFIEKRPLLESETAIAIVDNNNDPTIEIYDGSNLIFDNVNGTLNDKNN